MVDLGKKDKAKKKAQKSKDKQKIKCSDQKGGAVRGEKMG